MPPRDTDPRAQRLLDAHWLNMAPADKTRMLDLAWQTAEDLQLAGLRIDFPDADEGELRERMFERRLGPELHSLLRSRHPLPSPRP